MAVPTETPDSIQAASGIYYFPEVTRETSAAKIAEVERPIIRNSSRAGYYAISYYNAPGYLQHGLVRSALIDQDGRIIASTVPELIEMLRRINPDIYIPTEPRPLTGGRRRSSHHRKPRRTVRRQRR